MEEIRMNELERIPVPEGLEERLSQSIDEWAAAERRRKLRRRLSIAAAACVAVVVGLAIWNPATEPQGTERGALTAIAEVKLHGDSTNLTDNIIKEKNPQKELQEKNPVRDDLSVAQGFNFGKSVKKEGKSSPSVEAYLIAEAKVKEASPKGEDVSDDDGNPEVNPLSPGVKPRATARRSATLSQSEATERKSTSLRDSEALYASLSPEERLMKECDRLLLEEEYQYSEQQMRLVEL